MSEAPEMSLSKAQATIAAQAAEIAALQAKVEALTGERDAAFKSGQFAATDAIAKMTWNEGCPPHPYGDEWFIAKSKNRHKVVLRSLPDDYSYDYETADGTYIIAEQIIQWMQFPDSDFIPYVSALTPEGE